MPVLKPMRCDECGNTSLHRFHSCFHDFCNHEFWLCGSCGHRKYKCPACKDYTSRQGGAPCPACRNVRKAG